MRFWPYQNTLKRLKRCATVMIKQKRSKSHVGEWDTNKALKLADDMERVYNSVGGPQRLQAVHCIRWLVGVVNARSKHDNGR